MHCRFDLATRDADVAQGAIVEFAKPRDSGAAGEVRRDRFAAAADDNGKGCKHFQSPGEVIGLLRSKCSDMHLGAIETLISVQ
jgi:hypothetical protein